MSGLSKVERRLLVRAHNRPSGEPLYRYLSRSGFVAHHTQVVPRLTELEKAGLISLRIHLLRPLAADQAYETMQSARAADLITRLSSAGMLARSPLQLKLGGIPANLAADERAGIIRLDVEVLQDRTPLLRRALLSIGQWCMQRAGAVT